MESIKRIFGIVCMLLGPTSMGLLVWRATIEIGEKPSQENWIFWGIIITIFLPIALGMSIFGYYAWRGYYAKLPSKSTEIGD
jgi:predicted Na+-dependent transporter